jgi:hypothetical protein
MDSPLRRLSLADRVIRAMILEDEPGFDFILTYNISDFIDACRNSRVLMIASELAPEYYDL